RPSLLARVPGHGIGRSLALYAHADTVGLGEPVDALTPRRVDGRLHGRGAYDMKGSLAALLRVLEGAALNPLDGDLWLMLVADEECDSLGVEAVLAELARRGVRPAGCLVAEPSDLRVMVGHRGFATGRLETFGRAAHTARRDEGVDAIAMMARLVSGLEDLDARMNAGPGDPLLGHAAVVVSRLQGGSELFTYPDHCTAEFVWRMLPGERQTAVTAAIRERFEALRARDPRFSAQLTWQRWREPLRCDPADPLVQTLCACAAGALGAAPLVAGAPWWTDAALIQAAGIPAVIFGPCGGGIHGDDEWVDLESLATFERIVADLARSFCR
ncbi:MAG: M20/M25/M40 family metallo-hydrolase, partial [Thermoflexales bacterium]|nr:M20/M25/M40 family metallo-hydrolase [Thermoflexales bacterium]